MAKTDAKRRSRRLSQVVTSEVVEEEDNVKTEGQSETKSSTQIVGTDEDASKENRDEQDFQMDAVIEVKGSTATVTVSWDEKSEEAGVEDSVKRTKANDQVVDSVKGKRKARATVKASPSKKTKLINEGFCLFVGNLNNSKTFDEVKDSLANYFMTQSLLVQDIRLDRSKKHAIVDLASEMDLTKGLALNGEMINDKPMKIAKAKVKSDEVKVKAPAEDRKAKDGRCLFLKNVPYKATKQDILKIFCKAVSVRFPGGTEGPTTGIAFVEFKNETIAKKVQQRKQGVKIQGRVLVVDRVGERDRPKATKADEVKDDTQAAAPPNNTLFLSNLPFDLKEKFLKNVFQKAVSISTPPSLGKPKRFAFVKFATVADAEKALQSSQNLTILKRAIRVQFCKTKADSSKTLIVMGLAEKTTAEALKSAFDGASSARVAVDRNTGVSKRFGFVEFDSEDDCKAGKEAMEDCEIDGSKVTVAYAKAQGVKGPGLHAKPPLAPGGEPAGPGASKVGRKGGKHRKRGKKRGAGTPQNAVEEVENKS